MSNFRINLRIVTLVILVGLCSSMSLQGQWYSNWAYRVPVTITNDGNALSDFQVNVVLDESFAWNHVLPSGADIRFTDADMVTPVEFWVENWNYGTSASIWVKVPLVAGSPTSTTIYLYYGQSSATSASSGESTFDFFDDFTSPTIDMTKWMTEGSPILSVVNRNSNNVLSVIGPNNHFYYLESTDQSFTNFVLEMRIELEADANNDCTPEVAFRYYNYSNNYMTMLRGEVANDLSIRRFQAENDLIGPTSPANYSTGIVYDYSIRANGTSLELNVNDSYSLSWNDTGSGITTGGIGLGNYGNSTYAVFYDDIRIRKFADSEPTTSFGFEQNQYPPLNLSASITPVSCNGGSDGAINLSVTGGDGTYTYLWSPGGQTSEDLSGLSTGIYSVHVEDGNGPRGDANFTVTEPAVLNASYSITRPYDCADGNATIVISAEGGTPPYSGTGTFQQVIGTITYNVTDSRNCQTSVSVTVEPVAPWLSLSGWQYRDSVRISNPGGVALTDYQIHIGLDGSFDFSKTNSGGSDLRFTASDGLTQLSYWIEFWSPAADTASIWVKVPSISASGALIYMYYGNAAAESTSNGSATFRFFDDFGSGNTAPGYWLWQNEAHDWKYSAEMQEGALYYSIRRAQNSWATESLDSEIEDELDYIHLRLAPNGTISDIGGEPQYSYGILMSNLALGYLYFQTSNPTLAARCYSDLTSVYGYARDTYQNVIGLDDAGNSSKALQGFVNACKAFIAHGDATLANEARGIIQNYANTFVAAQDPVDGSWVLTGGIQEHMKRDIALMMAYDVTGTTAYLQSVNFNMQYVIPVFLELNGGLTWHGYGDITQPFFEVHQVWFMVAIRMLYERNSSYNYLAQGQAAWLFLTDNNYAGIDMYVHNYVNHYAFFCYRNVTSSGLIQSTGNNWKGSYETGSALWAMSLNYDWVSNKVSIQDGRTYNYLDMSVRQAKKSINNLGFVGPTPSTTGAWFRALQWFPSGYQPDVNLWNRVGEPVSELIQVDGNHVLSLTGTNQSNHFVSEVANLNNFILEANVLMTEDINGYSDPLIGFRYTDLNNRYYTQLRGTGRNDILLARYQGGSLLLSTTAPFDYTPDVYFNYKVAVNGNNIGLSINNAPILSYTDNGNLLSGRISIGSYGTYPVYYDNIRVREFAEDEPVATLGGTQFYDIQWTGLAGTSDWYNPANWSTCSLPTTSSNVSVSPASVYPVVTGTVECASLVIEPGANLTVGTGATLVAGSITINSFKTSQSGSLVNYGTVTGPVTFNRFLRPGNNFGDRHLVSSPVSGQNIGQFITAHSAKTDIVRIWNEELAQWVPLTSDNFISGRGYSIYQTDTSDGYFSFSGSLSGSFAPVTGTSPYAQPYNDRYTLDPADPYGENHPELSYWATGRSWTNYFGGGWNLLGNPFASSMSATNFVAANISNFDPYYQALYVYDGINSRYLYAGLPVPFYPVNGFFGENIQAGQGFFVLANNNGVQFSFAPTMQVDNGSDVILLKSASAEDKWPGLLLRAKYGEGESTTTIVFNSEMSAGLDPGYDLGQLSTGAAVEIYTVLAEKDAGVNLARQALPTADSEKLSIKLGVDTEKGGEITFSALTVPLGNKRFWLEDRTTGIFTDLSLKSYTVNLPSGTYGTGRFFIIASTNTPTAIKYPDEPEDGLRIWISGSRVVIQGEVGRGSVCELYDFQGRKLASQILSDNLRNLVDLPSGHHGLIMVRITDGNKVTTSKLSVL